MKWIGLTGGIASGKSTVSRMLQTRGIPVIDADLLAKQVVERGSAGLRSVTDTFGAQVLTASGDLDRAQIAEIVFNKPDQLHKLEKIIHPLVQDEVRKQKLWLQDQGTELAFYDVPLLFEKQLQSQFDEVVLVTCSEATQFARLKSRNGWDDSQIKARLQSQIPLREKEKMAQQVLHNDADLKFLEKQVADLIKVLSQ